MKPVFIAAMIFVPLCAPVPAFAQAPTEALTKCLLIDDMTKDRLDCFDAIIRPEALQTLQQPAPRSIYDCRYLKEQDARLKCFNRFVVPAGAPAAPKRAAPKP
jgi:hypothetical protein